MSSKIKVAEILGYFGSGGVESFAANVFSHFDFSHFEIDFIIDRDSSCFFGEKLKGTPIRIIKVNSCKKLHNPELYQLLKSNHYDVVHSHLNTLSVFPLREAKKAGVLVRIAHSHSSCGRGKGEVARNIAKRILRHFSKIYPNVLVSCSDVAAIFQFGSKAFKRGKVAIVPNCIDLASSRYSDSLRVSKRRELPINDDDVLLANVGRFMPQKNQRFLIEVFKRLHCIDPKYKLIFFGDGPTEEETKMLVQGYGLHDSVIFHEPTNQISSFYNAFDIFLLPSLYEGLPLTGLEAQANGLPCFFSDRITNGVLLNSNVYMIPLDVKKWEENIRGVSLSRVSPSSELTNGYSFESAAQKLENIYFESVKKFE